MSLSGSAALRRYEKLWRTHHCQRGGATEIVEERKSQAKSVFCYDFSLCLWLWLSAAFVVAVSCFFSFSLRSQQQKHPFSFALPCLRYVFAANKNNISAKRCVRHRPIVSCSSWSAQHCVPVPASNTSRSIKHMAHNELMVNCMMVRHTRRHNGTHTHTT